MLVALDVTRSAVKQDLLKREVVHNVADDRQKDYKRLRTRGMLSPKGRPSEKAELGPNRCVAGKRDAV